MRTVFEYKDSKSYLRTRLDGKGKKTAFAAAIGCQTSFVSQVLRGLPNLSLDQAVLANDYFAHSASEARHFLLLLERDRAGSHRLKQFFQHEIESSTQKHNRIVKRISPSKSLTERHQAIYYSSWIYGALHVLASLKLKNQNELFLNRTGLTALELDQALKYLVDFDLLKFGEDGRYTPTERRTHLSVSNALVLNHHRNYRLRAMEEMRVPNERNVHYSLLAAISEEDARKIKALIIQAIADCDTIIAPSVEEAVYQLNLDFFQI